MLFYLILLLGIFMIAVGSKYSHRRLVIRGREMDTKLILAFGAFMLVFVVLVYALHIRL